ncbi:MAG: hypothetical protein AAF566_07180 [Pseudomonadota bacterium]
MRVLVFLLALLPATAMAGPNAQFLNSIEQGLRDYRIETDVSKLTTAQAAAIHLLVSSPDESSLIPARAHVRQRLRTILTWNDATNPDLQ